MAVNTSTENKTSGSIAGTASVGETNRGVQQAHRIAGATPSNVSVRNQRTPQADPNQFSKDLNSIAKSIGAVAQDTYALNDAMVDEMASDDTSQLVTELERLDGSLKAGESRDGLIDEARMFRGGLIAKKDNFDGNVDMQARYKKKFVDTSATQTAAKIKKWQKENNAIDYARLEQSFENYKLNIYPKLLADGENNSEIIANANEVIDDYINRLAAHGEFSKDKHKLDFAQNMTSSFNAEINGDMNKYIGSSDESLIDLKSGKVNNKNFAQLWNDKYFYFGTMGDDLKISFRTTDAAVNEEIAKTAKTQIASLKSGRTQKVKKYNQSWQTIVNSYSTVAVRQPMDLGDFTYNSEYIADEKDRLNKATETFYKYTGMMPTKDQLSWAADKTIMTYQERNEAIAVNDAINNLYVPARYNEIAIDKQKDVENARGNELYRRQQSSLDMITLGMKDGNQEMVDIGYKELNQIQNSFKNPVYQREFKVFTSLAAKDIYTNPANNDAYEKYINIRSIINNPTGDAMLSEISLNKNDHKKMMLYNALYERHNEQMQKLPVAQRTEFNMNPEDTETIRKMTMGGVPPKQSEYIYGDAFNNDVYENSSMLTYDEYVDQKRLHQMQFVATNGEDIDFGKNSFNNKIPAGNRTFLMSVNEDGYVSEIVRKFTNVTDGGKFSYLDNMQNKVLSEIAKKDKKAANALWADGMVLQDIGNGNFAVYRVRGKAPLEDTGRTVNLSGWQPKDKVEPFAGANKVIYDIKQRDNSFLKTY